jgi:glutamyl-tRNA synthetase
VEYWVSVAAPELQDGQVLVRVAGCGVCHTDLGFRDEGVPTRHALPLILGQNRKRLSKRTGAASVEEFREAGILPQALYNYLALLGWNPGDDREVMSREELAEAFTTERLNDSAAVFDPEKLAWMNAQYMSSLPLAEILHHAAPFLAAAGLEEVEAERLEPVVELLRTRAKTLCELASLSVSYFTPELDYDAQLTAKFAAQGELPGHLQQLAERYAALESFDKDALEQELRRLSEELGVKAGYLIHPIRMALTAAKAGPPVFDVVELVGREATQRHLENFIAHLR